MSWLVQYLSNQLLNLFIESASRTCLLTCAYKAGRQSTSLDFVCRPATASVSGRSRLHSADDNQLLVPRTQSVTFGPRAFSTSGPDAWNTLSSELHHSSVSLDCFKRSLKTFLFSSYTWFSCPGWIRALSERPTCFLQCFDTVGLVI